MTGFFVTGSSIDALNGVYVRRNPPRSRPGAEASPAVLYYEHEEGMWHMALNSLEKVSSKSSKNDENDEGDDEDDKGDSRHHYYSGRRVEKKPKHEWVILDELDSRRFRHDGDTIIPGAGPRWSHAIQERKQEHSEVDPSSLPKTTAVTEIKDNDEEELPWQVIAILDVDMVQQLLWSSENRKQKVRDAKLGKNASAPPRASLEYSSAPGNWLFRVIKSDGVNLFCAPDETSDIAGRRKLGEYVKGFKLGNTEDWLCLDVSEDYTMDRPATPRMRADYFYNASYSRRQLWVRLSSLQEVSAEDTPVLDVEDVVAGAVSIEAAVRSDGQSISTEDLFDMPFIPRMEDADSEACDSSSITASAEIETLNAMREVTTNASVSPYIPMGAPVELAGLTTCKLMQYNGVTGVVISPLDSGFHGIRLDSPYRYSLFVL